MSSTRNDILALSDAPRWGRICSLWRSDAIRLAAIVPVVLSVVWAGWPYPITTFAVSALAVIGTQTVFAWARGRQMETGGLVTALAFALFLPAGTPVSHLVLGAVFGVLLGELIFGGRGFGFLNPAVVGLAFVHFSTPGAAAPLSEIGLIWAALGGAILLGAGLADWRVAAAASGFLGLAAIVGGAAKISLTGTSFFVVIFLLADPAAVPLARGARWLSGLLFVLLAVLMETGAAGPGPQALIFAALLSSVFGPLIDAGVLALRDVADKYRRRR